MGRSHHHQGSLTWGTISVDTSAGSGSCVWLRTDQRIRRLSYSTFTTDLETPTVFSVTSKTEPENLMNETPFGSWCSTPVSFSRCTSSWLNDCGWRSNLYLGGRKSTGVGIGSALMLDHSLGLGLDGSVRWRLKDLSLFGTFYYLLITTKCCDLKPHETMYRYLLIILLFLLNRSDLTLLNWGVVYRCIGFLVPVFTVYSLFQDDMFPFTGIICLVHVYNSYWWSV